MANQPAFGCLCCHARTEAECDCDFGTLRSRCRECRLCAAHCPPDCDGRRMVCNLCDQPFSAPLPICRAPRCEAACCHQCRDERGVCADCCREELVLAEYRTAWNAREIAALLAVVGF